MQGPQRLDERREAAAGQRRRVLPFGQGVVCKPLQRGADLRVVARFAPAA
jgi:hypothetical protein